MTSEKLSWLFILKNTKISVGGRNWFFRTKSWETNTFKRQPEIRMVNIINCASVPYKLRVLYHLNITVLLKQLITSILPEKERHT